MSTSIQEGTDTQLGALHEEEFFAWLEEQPEAGCEWPIEHGCTSSVTHKVVSCEGDFLVCAAAAKDLKKIIEQTDSYVRCLDHLKPWHEHNYIIPV